MLSLLKPFGRVVQETDLPQYDAIKAEHVVPGIRALLKQLNR